MGSEEQGATPTLRQLFVEHASYVWGSLRRLGVPAKDRDDLTQEVFITVHALLEDYDHERPFRPWVFGIAYRVVLRYRRRVARAPGARAEAPEIADASPGADEELVAQETRKLVRAAIDSIEIHRRAVFIMKDVDGVAVPEIAEGLGIPLNTAYSRLRLAREDFRDAVKRLQAESGRTVCT